MYLYAVHVQVIKDKVVSFSPPVSTAIHAYTACIFLSHKKKKERKRKKGTKNRKKIQTTSVTLHCSTSYPILALRTHFYLAKKKKKKKKKKPQNKNHTTKNFSFFSVLVVPGTRLHVNRIETHTPV